MLSVQLPPEVFGGAEAQCLRQSKALVERGHDITILSSRKKYRTPSCETTDGFTVRRFYTVGQPDLLGRYILVSFLWIFQCLYFALIHRKEFDIVHCHQGKFGVFVGAMMAWIMGVPQIVKIGNAGEYMDLICLQHKKVVGPIFLKLALRHKPTFIAISQKIAMDLKEFGIDEKQIICIPNTVKSIQARYRQPNKALKIFWHGRFESIKNLQLLVEGFVHACRQDTALHLYLIGDGSEKPFLVNAVKQHGLEATISFESPSTDVVSRISAMDIFLNTSLAEGMSNAMLEALSLGKLIVSTSVSGTEEIIDEGNGGFVIPDYTPEAVAETLLKAAAFYREHAQEVFHYNTEKAKRCFAGSVVAGAYERLYGDLQQKDHTTP